MELRSWAPYGEAETNHKTRMDQGGREERGEDGGGEWLKNRLQMKNEHQHLLS